jgi:hypothetical protein
MGRDTFSEISEFKLTATSHLNVLLSPSLIFFLLKDDKSRKNYFKCRKKEEHVTDSLSIQKRKIPSKKCFQMTPSI